MPIDKVNPTGGVPSEPLKDGLHGAQRPEQAAPEANSPGARETESGGASHLDRADVSSAARELSSSSARSVEPSLPLDRLQQLLHRVATDFFDTQEVRLEIAQRVLGELRG